MGHLEVTVKWHLRATIGKRHVQTDSFLPGFLLESRFTL